MSTTDKQLIETELASVERVCRDLIEIRFKANVKLDLPGIVEVMEAKSYLAGDQRVDVLVVLCAEMDVALNVMSMDHQVPKQSAGSTSRLALASESELNKDLAEIFFRYNSLAYETQVFVRVEDARAWLIAAQRLN